MFVKVIHNGKEIDVPRAHGRRLVEAGRAKWPDSKDMQSEPSEPVPPSEVVSSPDPTAELSGRTGKPKRQYKRRDMQAED